MAVGMGRILGRFLPLSGTFQRFIPNGVMLDRGSVSDRVQTPTYGASITFDMNDGSAVRITATNGVAFTINAPTNPVLGQQLILEIRNTSGGALGAITFNAVFKLPAFTAPATGFSRAMHFYFDGTNWREIVRGTDTPN